MSIKHTPGPWEYKEQGDANHYILVKRNNNWLFSIQHNGEQWTPEQIANMKLIAASPEMFRVLIWMMDNCDAPADEIWAKANSIIKQLE